VHPREVDAHFAHGTVTTMGRLVERDDASARAMHYRGLLRVACRENGIRFLRGATSIRLAAGFARRRASVDALVDVRGVRSSAAAGRQPVVTGRSGGCAMRRRSGAASLTQALQRAKRRLAHVRIEHGGLGHGRRKISPSPTVTGAVRRTLSGPPGPS
jgi:hypothetical protein